MRSSVGPVWHGGTLETVAEFQTNDPLRRVKAGLPRHDGEFCKVVFPVKTTENNAVMKLPIIAC
jgi:hypothetical protein